MYLIPGTTHVVTWVPQNQLDSTDFYPLAEIRDVRTDELLDTIVLEDLGSRRYSATWNVVQDPTGFGREISILTKVYTDAAHTVVSAMYGFWDTRFIVFNLASRQASSGGYGASVDYRKIREMIEEALKSQEPPQKVDIRPVIDKVSEASERLESIMDELKGSIDGLGDGHASTMGNMTELMTELATSLKDAKDSIKGIKDTIESEIRKGIESVTEAQARGEKMSEADLEQKMSSLVEAAVRKVSVAAEKAAGKVESYMKRIDAAMQKPIKVAMVANSVFEEAPAEAPKDKRKSVIEKLIGQS